MKFADASGRGIGESYMANCQLNAILQQKYGTTDIHAYRFYLQHNAEQIIKELKPVDEKDCKKCPVCLQSVESKQ